MYRKVIFPVDLTHFDQLEKALNIATDLARHFKAELCFLGVTGTAPSPIAHSPSEYAQRLANLAQDHARDTGLVITSKACHSPDPTIDLDKTLLHAIRDLGGDLVVMQTHAPSAVDYIWAGHGDTVAAHSEASVFLVR